MDAEDAIKRRYSCREYLDREIEKKIILELLELANWAPSAANRQNRNFVVITDKKDRKFLGDMNKQPHLEQAPVVILVTGKLNAYFKDRNDYLQSLKEWEMKAGSEIEELPAMINKMMVSDTAAAVENLMLAATDRGLATCWVGVMDFKEIKKRFGLPKDEEPICLVTLGYAKEETEEREGRKKIEEIVYWERWGEK